MSTRLDRRSSDTGGEGTADEAMLAHALVDHLRDHLVVVVTHLCYELTCERDKATVGIALGGSVWSHDRNEEDTAASAVTSARLTDAGSLRGGD